MNMASIVGMVGLAVLGLLLGWWLGKGSMSAALAVSQQRTKDLELRNAQNEGEIQGLRKEKAALEIEKAGSEAKLGAAQQSLVDERASLTRSKAELVDAFKALAGRCTERC